MCTYWYKSYSVYNLCFSVHMCTYRQELIDRYARLSAILEMDISLAQQAQREVRFIFMNV